jgi:hypothetical protein
VIAEGRGSEPELIEDFDDRSAEGEVRCCRALELIAAIQQEHVTFDRRAFASSAMNGVGKIGRAAPHDAVAISPRLERAMEVVGRDDAKSRARRRALRRIRRRARRSWRPSARARAGQDSHADRRHQSGAHDPETVRRRARKALLHGDKASRAQRRWGVYSYT